MFTNMKKHFFIIYKNLRGLGFFVPLISQLNSALKPLTAALAIPL